METLKTALATIGVMAIVVTAGFFLFYTQIPSDESGDSEAGSSSASTYSYSEDIKAELQRYADILNEKGTLYVNTPLFSNKSSTNYAVAYQYVYSINPTRGTVEVVGTSLEFDYVTSSNYGTNTDHYIVPYHAISDIKVFVSYEPK